MPNTMGPGGIGLRVCGDHFGGDGEGVPSYLDVNRTWIASGEDPVSTFGYAGIAAHLAFALRIAHVKDPEGIDWLREARESYVWAIRNTRQTDEAKVRPNRAYAAAALFRLTGEKPFERSVSRPGYGRMSGWIPFSAEMPSTGRLSMRSAARPPTERDDPETLARMRAAILHTADTQQTRYRSEARALRWGGDFSFSQCSSVSRTTPLTLPTAVAYTLVKRTDPPKARIYLATL